MAINYKICPQRGCAISDDSPEYACKDCNKQWSRAEIIESSYKSIRRIKAFVGGYFGSNYNVDLELIDMKIS